MPGNQLYPTARQFVGNVFGMDAYFSRCHINPNVPFARIDDDVFEDDLSELQRRLELAFGLETSPPLVEMKQTFGSWFADLLRWLQRHGVTEETACEVLSQHLDNDERCLGL